MVRVHDISSAYVVDIHVVSVLTSSSVDTRQPSAVFLLHPLGDPPGLAETANLLSRVSCLLADVRCISHVATERQGSSCSQSASSIVSLPKGLVGLISG